jgi:dihydroorotate dehydrogenase electron transfer subunit
MPPLHQQALIVSVSALSPHYYLLTLQAPDIAAAAQPGQFAQVRVARPGVLDPLLARPLSIYRADAVSGQVSFIFKVVGHGTALLAAYTAGETLTLLGPIGQGFTVPERVEHLALVAGGVGMPPLYFLAETLRRARPNMAITLCYGGRSRADLLELPRWETLGVRIFAATDDGSYGSHGLVTVPLSDEHVQHPFDYLAACGPRPMLRAVQQFGLAEGIPGQLSLEARMACGVGACLGCVCAVVSGNRRVCIDGPVFALDEVRFDV